MVINCDLPWNPARLEQRISRAWRKHQTRPVTVIHLVSEGTIEHKMIGTLKTKQALAEGVLDLRGDLNKLALTSGRQTFLSRLQQLLGPSVAGRGLKNPSLCPWIALWHSLKLPGKTGRRAHPLRGKLSIGGGSLCPVRRGGARCSALA